MSKEVMQIAIDALDRLVTYDNHGEPYDGKDVEGAEAIEALRAALNQRKEWVGLTEVERIQCEIEAKCNYVFLCTAIEEKLKDKNT